MLFERVFIGLYDTGADHFGEARFFDVMSSPPKHGRPEVALSFDELISAIVSTYDARNRPTFVWADAAPEPVSLPDPESDTDDGEPD